MRAHAIRRLARSAAVLLAFVLALPLVSARQTREPALYRILVTNDDGIRAPGLAALAESLSSLGEVTVVAPAENQTASSHALQLSAPLFVDAMELPGARRAFAVTGTPATTVKLALGALVETRPDLVVSGINRDQNLGMVAYISGTVGAAREAALQGLPAIAVSLRLGEGAPDYQPAAAFARQIAARVRTHPLPPGVFLNVNVPPGPADAIKGIRLARQSPQWGTERFVEFVRPGQNRRYFWNTYDGPAEGAEGDDVWAISQGYVAVTPLRAGEFDAATFREWQGMLR